MRHWFLIFSVFGLLLIGCNDLVPVGSEILPDGDGQGNFFNDTTTIFTTTVREDSLRTDKLFFSQLGFMNDPIFGTTKSSLLIGFRSPNVFASPSLLDIIGGYTLDSIVLSLVVNAVYGDSTIASGFKVYQLSDPLAFDQAYYSNVQFEQGMIEVGEIVSYVPKLSEEYIEPNNDTIHGELGTQLRIKLNPFFGQSIINALETEEIKSNVAFHKYLPGLIIVPNNQGGYMMEMDMIVNTATTSRKTALEDSRLHLYYKNAVRDTLNLIIPATVIDLGISKYLHDYTNTNIETALTQSNPLGDAINYVQGLAGVKTKVEFPSLSYYDTIAIQKAELVITQVMDGFEGVFSPPEKLFVVKIGTDGINENTSDFIQFSAAHSGGFGKLKTISVGEEVMEYRINISDQLQRIIFGQDANAGFYITLYSAQDTEITNLNASDLIPDRLVIGGGNNSSSNYKIKLDLTYTSF